MPTLTSTRESMEVIRNEGNSGIDLTNADHPQSAKQITNSSVIVTLRPREQHLNIVNTSTNITSQLKVQKKTRNNITRSHSSQLGSKRRSQREYSLQIPENENITSLTEVTSFDPCSGQDPCGEGKHCRPSSERLGNFICLCPDGTEIAPSQTCLSSKGISRTPLPLPQEIQEIPSTSSSRDPDIELADSLPSSSSPSPEALESTTTTTTPTTKSSVSFSTTDSSGSPSPSTGSSVTPPSNISSILLSTVKTSYTLSSKPSSHQAGYNSTKPSSSKPKAPKRIQRTSSVKSPEAKALQRVPSPNGTHKDDACAGENPCGKNACHFTPDKERPFTCLCPDRSQVAPNGTCEDQIVDYDPQAKPVSPSNHSLIREPAVNNSTNMVGAAVAASALVMVLVSLVYLRRKSLLAVLRQRHRHMKARPHSPGSLAKSSSLLTYNFASNPNYYAQAPDAPQLHTLDVHLIDKEQITFIGELGEGCFGKVYKGEYGPRCPESLGTPGDIDGGRGRSGRGGGVEGGGEVPQGTVGVTVAVKVLKESAGREAEADFLREVEIMSAFRHESILPLIGIVAAETGGTPWMVFEYMPYGDLAEVLRSCSQQFFSNESSIKSLGKEDLINISVQIASGMEYLSSQHFVHRDLACRNCLVGDNLVVKISDFGMSRDVYTCDYYKVGGSRMLPVRWMSPESIMYGKFTLESDVWSFGVVLWEIYSFGKQPYYGNSNDNVINLIQQGILLSPPDTCPAQVCDVMRRCWSTEPHDRLKFPEILARLTRILHGEKGATPPPTPPTPSTSITYSELCMHDDGGLQLDADQYLMPKRTQVPEYLTVISSV